MKKAIYGLSLFLAFQVANAGNSNEFAKNILLVDACKEINKSLRGYTGYVSPTTNQKFFKNAYLKTHQRYIETRNQVKSAGLVTKAVTALNLNTAYVDMLIDSCMKLAPNLLEAQNYFSNFPSSNKISIALLERHNSYILKIETKKIEATLDVDRQLENMAQAKRSNLVVGEETFNNTPVGKVLSSNFDQWSFINNLEWSKIRVKVIGKTHSQTNFVKLSSGEIRNLNAAEFSSALAAFKADADNRLVYQNILGHERFEAFQAPLSKTDVVKVVPMTRYYAKIRIQNVSFTLDYDQAMQNLVTMNEVEVEIPKEAYFSQNKAFKTSANLGTLILKDRFDVLSGTIIKKYTATDHRWSEVTLKSGEILYLENSFLTGLN